MTAQAQSAPEAQHPTQWQQTPVIIKVGGGDDYDPTKLAEKIHVVIESDFMAFTDPVPGLTWETAQSTSMGRIIEFTFIDGKLPRQDFAITPSNELVSVRIEHGMVQLVAMESGIAPTSVFLVLASLGVPFNVETDGNWNQANADFPPITRVVLMQGTNVIVDYKFQFPHDVHLNVQFLENEN